MSCGFQKVSHRRVGTHPGRGPPSLGYSRVGAIPDFFFFDISWPYLIDALLRIKYSARHTNLRVWLDSLSKREAHSSQKANSNTPRREEEKRLNILKGKATI